MSLRTNTTRSGRAIDLLAPSPGDIRLSDIAEQLANLNRWTGATAAPFSIAQHCVIVAEEMHRLDGALAGLYGLLHDAHEYVIGDIVEPTAGALAALIGPAFPRALSTLKRRIDGVIHHAFDIDWPISGTMAGLLDCVHAQVRVTEMRDIAFGYDDHIRSAADEGIRPLGRRIVPYTSYVRADEEYRRAFSRYAALAGIRQREV